MADLERALRELSSELEFPLTPELAAPVGRRLRSRRPPAWRWRRPLVVVLAVLLAALAAVLAVPPARTALLELLGLEGATIRRVDRLPAVRADAPLRLGDRVSLVEARRRARVPVRVPRRNGYGEPDAVYLDATVPGGAVSLLYGSERDVRILLTTLRGTTERPFVDKAAGSGTSIEPVVVDGETGYWLEGDPHVVIFRSPDGDVREERLRLAANTLLWEDDGLLLRLEGDLAREEAIRVAQSLE